MHYKYLHTMKKSKVDRLVKNGWEVWNVTHNMSVNKNESPMYYLRKVDHDEINNKLKELFKES